MNFFLPEKLKTKANLAIDSSKGRNMLGVIDETGTLNYGEVFVQYSRDLSYGETMKETVVQIGNFSTSIVLFHLIKGP